MTEMCVSFFKYTDYSFRPISKEILKMGLLESKLRCLHTLKYESVTLNWSNSLGDVHESLFRSLGQVPFCIAPI